MNMHANVAVAGIGTPAGVQAYAGRNLDLLQAIEKTIDCLTDNADLLNALTVSNKKNLKQLQAALIQQPLDPEGRVCELLSRCLELLARMNSFDHRRRQAAIEDPELKRDDGVVEAYDVFLHSVCDLHDTVGQLKDWIETHDALLEPALPGEFQTVDSLVKAITNDK